MTWRNQKRLDSFGHAACNEGTSVKAFTEPQQGKPLEEWRHETGQQEEDCSGTEKSADSRSQKSCQWAELWSSYQLWTKSLRRWKTHTENEHKSWQGKVDDQQNVKLIADEISQSVSTKTLSIVKTLRRPSKLRDIIGSGRKCRFVLHQTE